MYDLARHHTIAYMQRLISVSFSVGLLWCIENSWERVDFSVGPILLECVISLFSICEFHQEIKEIVSACILSFIEMSIARVMLIVLCLALVIIFVSLIIVHEIASKPSLKS